MGKVKERREKDISVSQKGRLLISLQGKRRCCKLLMCKENWGRILIDNGLVLFWEETK